MPRKTTKSPRAEASVKMLVRILDLGSRGRFPVVQLTGEGGWGSQRTIERLLDNLNEQWELLRHRRLFNFVDESGIPVNPYAKKPKYIQLNDVDLDREEAKRLTKRIVDMVAFFNFSKPANDSLKEEFDEIKGKLLSRLTHSDKALIDRASRKFSTKIKGAKQYVDDDGPVDALLEVYRAIVDECPLEYTRPGDLTSAEQKRVVVHPLNLTLFNGGLYMLAIFPGDPSPGHPKVYRFRVETIIDPKCLRREKFTYPSWFDPEKELARDFGMTLGRQPQQVVKLRFAADRNLHEYLMARRYTPDQNFFKMPDGTLEMTFKAMDMTEVRSFVLGFGSSVEVLAPQDLRDKISAEVHRLHEAYTPLKKAG